MTNEINGFAVLDRLMLISGISKEDAAKHLSACSYELTCIKKRIKKDVNALDFAEDILVAAASQVFVTVVTAEAVKSEASFSIGDGKVDNGFKERLDFAKTFRDNAFLKIAHILTDEGFAFVGVR